MAPPQVRPIMITMRGTGATIVSFKKPNWRSQISSMPENTAGNRMVMPITPGEELDIIALRRPFEKSDQTEA